MITIFDAVHSDQYKRDDLYKAMVNDFIKSKFEECDKIYGYLYGRPSYKIDVGDEEGCIKVDKLIEIEKVKCMDGYNPDVNVNGDSLIYVWGFPGPDYNKYEFKDYGHTWAFTKEEICCPICYTCDTRTRLQMCKGRTGNFKYCFRKVGSLTGLEKTITPFNDPEDIFENSCDYIQGIQRDSLELDLTDYGTNKYMCLMFGKWDIDGKEYPVGYVTKLGEKQRDEQLQV